MKTMATKKSAPESKAVTKSDNVPAYIRQGAARGSEQVEQGDIALPRIDIIQDLSPQHKETKPEYIPGAKVGMLFNTLTRELYPNGVSVVPVWYDKQFLVWKDQKKGGGLKGVFGKHEKTQAENHAMELGDDYECVETPTQIVIVVDDDGQPLYEATIPLSKSKMKVNRQWNSLIMMNGGDRFSRQYRLESVEDQNSEGQEYLNYRVNNEGYATEEAYLRAEKLYESISSGARTTKANYSDVAEERTEEETY
jgi:hypothetical protein